MTLDPIRFEVVRHALLAATEEMALSLRRSAYSTNIKTRSDFSCAFFDRELRAVAQAFTQPVHLGSFVELVPRAVRAFGQGRLAPGDMLVTNDPYGGGVWNTRTSGRADSGGYGGRQPRMPGSSFWWLAPCRTIERMRVRGGAIEGWTPSGTGTCS